MKLRLILSSGLLAMTVPAFAEEITVSGCAAVGAEANCIILKADDGKIYDITAAQPAPAPGTYGRLKGVLTDRMSVCQEGMIVDPALWEVEPGKQCPIETSK